MEMVEKGCAHKRHRMQIWFQYVHVSAQIFLGSFDKLQNMDFLRGFHVFALPLF